jgi:hypothetical protein
MMERPRDGYYSRGEYNHARIIFIASSFACIFAFNERKLQLSAPQLLDIIIIKAERCINETPRGDYYDDYYYIKTG